MPLDKDKQRFRQNHGHGGQDERCVGNADDCLRWELLRGHQKWDDVEQTEQLVRYYEKIDHEGPQE